MLMRLLFFIKPCCVALLELSAYIITGFIWVLTKAKSLQACFRCLIIKIVLYTTSVFVAKVRLSTYTYCFWLFTLTKSDCYIGGIFSFLSLTFI